MLSVAVVCDMRIVGFVLRIRSVIRTVKTTEEQREEERATATSAMLSASCLGHWQPSGTVHGLFSDGVSLEYGVRTPSVCPLETAAGLT